MKSIITLSIMMLMAVATMFGQAQKTLVKSLDTKGAVVLVAAMQGDFKVKETETQFVRITTTINVENFSEDILKKLVEVGRYNIHAEVDASGKMMLLMPALEKRVIIKGVDLIERLSFEIEVPKGVKVEIASKPTQATATASNSL